MRDPTVRRAWSLAGAALLVLSSLGPIAGCSDNVEGNPDRGSLSVPRNQGGEGPAGGGLEAEKGKGKSLKPGG